MGIQTFLGFLDIHGERGEINRLNCPQFHFPMADFVPGVHGGILRGKGICVDRQLAAP
jgi:hypothetical protein